MERGGGIGCWLTEEMENIYVAVSNDELPENWDLGFMKLSA
jgi:hypothetical protein